MPRGQARTLLESPEYLGEPGRAAEFLDYVDQRAGLLVGRGGEYGKPITYSFPHRTFQEYLAGCYLAGQREIARAYYARAGEGDYRNLAALLGIEELYYNRRGGNALLDLAYHLCKSDFPQQAQGQRALLWSSQIAALLGLDIIKRDTGSPDGGVVYLEKLKPQLVSLLASDQLHAVERAEAGRALGRLDDPRPEVTSVDSMQLCWVPAGSFRMGSTPEEIESLTGGSLGFKEFFRFEAPQHDVDLPGFFIARHPVTNAHFNAFVGAEGYKDAKYWLEAKAKGLWKGGIHVPIDPIPQSVTSGLGASGIKYEERENLITTRNYPWGDEFDPEKANSGETGIGNTSAVGCFPGGASPYGVQDLSGNVWEWTCTLWGKEWDKPKHRYPYNAGDGREKLGAPKNTPRVLRGGSFVNVRWLARCAYRYRSDPSRQARPHRFSGSGLPIGRGVALP